MSTVDCAFHGPETDHPGDYGSCLECCHIWRTETDWRADVIRSAGDAGTGPDFRQTICPLCCHDLLRPPWAERGVIQEAVTVERGAALLPGEVPMIRRTT